MKYLTIIFILQFISCMSQENHELLPDRFSHQINQTQYDKLVDMTQDYCSNYGKVSNLKDGKFSIDDGSNQIGQIWLDNLVKKIADQPENDWNAIINNHFTALGIGSKSQNYDLSDFSKLKDKLAIRVYSDSYFEQLDRLDSIIYKVDFEGTKSVLVYNFPDHFEVVKNNDAEKWGIPRIDLFLLAQKNINRYEVEVFETHSEKPNKMFTFVQDDYALSYALDLEQNAPFSIGKYGAIVNIVSRGKVFVHPLSENNAGEIIPEIEEMIDYFYENEPYPVSNRYYWFYEGKFMIFPTFVDEQGRSYCEFPDGLINLFKK